MSGEVWKARSPTIEQHKAEVMSCGILKRLQQSMPAGAEPTAARRCICRDAYYAFSAVIARLMQALHGGEVRLRCTNVFRGRCNCNTKQWHCVAPANDARQAHP